MAAPPAFPEGTCLSENMGRQMWTFYRLDDS